MINLADQNPYVDNKRHIYKQNERLVYYKTLLYSHVSKKEKSFNRFGYIDKFCPHQFHDIEPIKKSSPN